MNEAHGGRTGLFPAEVVGVWGLFVAVTAAILVTYSRLPPEDLYHVSGSGLRGGASRALVFVNYPLALVAIAVLLVLLARPLGRAARGSALVGILVAGVIFWPGVVTEADLDARPVNVVPALGVAAAAWLTVLALWGAWPPRRLARQPGDGLRVVVAVVALALGLPWIGAELGLSFEDARALGSLYQTTELRAQPGIVELQPAVHPGHHHGMDGVLLVLTALLLSRLVGSVADRRLRLLLGAYLALMFTYGAGNLVQDFWLEQVVKRGWTEWELPNVTTPKASVAWAVIILSAAALWLVSVWRLRASQARSVVTAAEAA